MSSVDTIFMTLHCWPSPPLHLPHLPICRCTFSGKSKWYVASASPAALSIGSENQIPKIFMQFPSMETFFTNLANRYRCARCTFWTCCMDYLSLVKAFLRFSWDSFIAESKIDTEFVLQFPSLWCHFIGIWSKEKTKLGSINGCQMDGLDSHICLSSLKLK